MKEKALLRKAYSFKETKGLIITDRKEAIQVAENALCKHRKQLETYIESNPLFMYSLKPIILDNSCPTVVERMAQHSQAADVGPMAAVAGALADLAVESMIVAGAKVAVVENGGEASAISNIPIDIALSAGYHVLSKRVGFRLEYFPIGIATSSGKFSHALSLGEADSVTVFADNAGLADAAATAAGNMVKGNDEAKAVEIGLRRGMAIKGVKGMFILYRQKAGQAGEIPQKMTIKDD
jgi:ApbE superfamily uncharacterized protein (UPF0280 family)